MKKTFIALSSVSLIVGLSGNVFALSFNDFSSTDGLTLNGSATTVTTGDGDVLRLTPALGGRSGSAFSTQTVNAADFSSFFQFRITEPGNGGADGIGFSVQSVSSSIGGEAEGWAMPVFRTALVSNLILGATGVTIQVPIMSV